MNNDNVPLELARALGWRSGVNSEESEERTALELFEKAIAPIPNPWTNRPGVGGVVQFTDEEAEEMALQGPLNDIRKLFQPQQTAATMPWQRASTEQDAEENYFASPLEKLFSGNSITTTAPAEAPRFQFTKRVTPSPAPAKSPTLTYKKTVIGDNVWNEGRDDSGEVVSMMLVTDETDE